MTPHESELRRQLRALSAELDSLEDLEVPVCINCRRVFAEADARFYYSAVTASAAVRQVGPLCESCEGVLTIARAVCR